MAEPAVHRGFCVVLHDVAPSQWPLYRPLVEEADRLGLPLTLLVVPDFHRRDRIDRAPEFLRSMENRLARGDEIVLHGWFHDDPGPVPLRPEELFMRRVFTHEGEFYRLGAAEALQRMQDGLALFSRLGWPVHGFVAPAWLLGREARRALSSLPLDYTSDPGGLIRLPAFQHLAAPTLVWSSGTWWRRLLSLAWNTARLDRHRRSAPLIRLGLHPVDMRHRLARGYWLRTMAELLRDRRPMTKHQWLEAGQ
ncbi:MAG TPA: DUF2334 domain-containing protein [Desulfobulbus sp.]|nr:DUF2334 domain-containing protein [Desulfobulbus sp.]